MFKNNKYGSRKQKDKPRIDGYVFDSKIEFERYIELKSKQQKGLISELEVHPKFTLSPPSKNEHGQKISKWGYTADFMYHDNEKKYYIVEDAKSLRIDKKGKRHGTSQSRDYKLTRNQFMRMNPHILLREIY